MNLSPEIILMVIGAGASLATTIFYGAFYLGEYRQQLRGLREDFNKHCQDFNVHIDRRYRSEHAERP